MNQLKPKRETPEIYAIGDQVAVYTTEYGKSKIKGIYPVAFITAHEAILRNDDRDRIPLQKGAYEQMSPLSWAWTGTTDYKPAEQADFDALELKNGRAKAASLIQDLRNIYLPDLDIKAVTALNSALENAIKSIEP